MPGIFPVQTCDVGERAGFSLIEVIVATAVVAMTVAATTTSVLLSQRLEDAAFFYQDALLIAEKIQAVDLGLLEPDADITPDGYSIEREKLSPDHQRNQPGWITDRIRSDATDRSVLVVWNVGDG